MLLYGLPETIIFTSDSAGLLTNKETVLDVAPVPPSLETMDDVVFNFVPLVTPVTLTEIVHVPPPAIEALLSVMVVSPGAGENTGTVDALHPEIVAAGDVDTCKPDARSSVNPMPVKIVDALLLANVKESTVSPPTEIIVGVNAFVMVGGTTTSRTAEAVVPFPPFVEVTALLVFVHEP